MPKANDMNSFYDDLITLHWPEFEKGLAIISDKIEISLIPNTPDLELVSFDILQIKDLLTVNVGINTAHKFEDEKTFQQILLFTSDYLTINLDCVAHFAKMTFSTRFVPGCDWSSSKVTDWEVTNSIDDLGFVYTYMANGAGDCFFILVPMKSLVNHYKKFAA